MDNSEPKIPAIPEDSTPQVMETEEPKAEPVPKAPFYVADEHAPTEPSAIPAPSESAAIL